MPFQIHPDLTTPPGATILWRYMDFAKFVHMIETKTLWFSRQDQFEDPLEGTYTDGELEHFRSSPDTSRFDLIKLTRGTNFVNCWRSGSAESLAMWDLYGKGSGIVAVKTTVKLLKQAVSSFPKRVYLTKVDYIDWNTAPLTGNFLVGCARKDLSYEHEKEVRAMIWETAPAGSTLQTIYDGPVGIEVPFDPQLFITEVVVGPREPGWVAPLVQRIMTLYGLPHPVKTSNRLKARS
jgi:hypothetical protein